MSLPPAAAVLGGGAVLAGFREPKGSDLQYQGVSAAAERSDLVVGGVGGEGRGGSQQKLTSHKLFPLQPISGRSLLTYVFPFTLQYVCQRAIAPLTPTLLFMPSLFAHFNPVPFITAHPSPSLSSTSDSYFLICLGFSPFGVFLPTSSLPLNSPPSVPST